MAIYSKPSLKFMMDPTDALLLALGAMLAALWWRLCFCKPSAADGLPPGPPGWPVVGNLLQVVLQRRPFMYVVRDLRAVYGPIFTLRMGQRTLIVVTSAELIHEALVRKGPTFASRPPDSPTRLIFSVGKCAINSAEYGPLWRTLRRNFITEVVSPSRVKGFRWIREWAIANHMARLRAEYEKNGSVEVMANCRLTICSILVCICFGARVPDEHVRRIEAVLKDVMMMTTPKLPDFLPVLTPFFRGQLRAARKLRRRQMDCLLPLVRARRAFVESGGEADPGGRYEMVSPVGSAYADSLFALDPAGRGPLGEAEVVTLCSEAMSAGTDTSATALEWALLHLVLDPASQERLHGEIARKVGAGREGRRRELTESEVEGMEYLTAVVKETLRRHPPSHFVLSHAGIKETELGGYRIPLGASLEIYTAWVVEDPDAWEDPGAWRPERFLRGGEGWEVDVSGARGVRMVPFGAGRRICPAASLGILHVQLMLASMIREFRWTPVKGTTPSTEETFAFTVVMKEPLRAEIEERNVTEVLGQVPN